MLKIFCDFSIQPVVDLDEIKICLENGQFKNKCYYSEILRA